MPKILAIIFSSILFSFGHLDLENIWIFLINGIFLGFIYLNTKNIYAAIYTHILINFLITFTNLNSVSNTIGLAVYIISISLIIILIYYLSKITKKKLLINKS